MSIQVKVTLIIACLVMPASATTYYISQSGGSVSCGADGTQSTQAFSFSGYTTGDTLKLCGQITSDLTVQANNISIIFESGSGLFIPACGVGCIQINGHTGGLIDGGTPCGPGTTCSTNFGDYGMGSRGTGYIIQTTVGTPSASITNITCSAGVATVTGPAAFGYSQPNQPQVTITGNSVSAYNATVTVTSNTDASKQFTFAATCGGTGTGGSVGVLCPNGSYCSSTNGAVMIDTSNSGGSGWEIRNLLFGPFYQKTSFQDTINEGNPSTIYMIGSSNTWSIHDNTMARGDNIYVPANTGDSHFQFYKNAILGTTVGLQIAGSTSSNNISGAQIHDNYIQDLGVGDKVGCPDHISFLHSWALSGAVATGENIYNNTIAGNSGGCLTGSIFLEGLHQTTNVFNNVFISTYTQNNNGIVGLNGPGPFLIANNTFFGNLNSDLCFTVGTPSGGAPTVTFKNNLVAGCSTPLQWKNSPTVTEDHDTFGCDSEAGNCIGGGWSSTSIILCVYVSSCTYYDLAQMQGTLGIDANSTWNFTASSTKVSTSTGKPSAGSPVIANGANLTSLGIAALDSDASGAARPSSGAWDIGAYQFINTQPSSPTIGMFAMK